MRLLIQKRIALFTTVPYRPLCCKGATGAHLGDGAQRGALPLLLLTATPRLPYTEKAPLQAGGKGVDERWQNPATALSLSTSRAP
ncbi:hypothetical protein HMPREF0262_00511 [Clostridium sp. ATCC 29733]|nr:hypothetical protein HMPREF0262_00511 [Clostridium sp. ATCC 29733]